MGHSHRETFEDVVVAVDWGLGYGRLGDVVTGQFWFCLGLGFGLKRCWLIWFGSLDLLSPLYPEICGLGNVFSRAGPCA